LANGHPLYHWDTPKVAHLMRHFMGEDRKLVAVHLVTPNKMAMLNWTYRHKMRTTDILSFRFPSDDKKVLGEIALCPDIAIRRLQGTREHVSSQAEVNLRLAKLLAHGMAHLLGHDHQNIQEFRVMRRVENGLLDGLRVGRIIKTR